MSGKRGCPIKARATVPLRARRILLSSILSVSFVAVGLAQEADFVAGTLHNLSASGPGEVRASDEREICKFCHIPHNAVVPVPLWGHALSEAVYRVPEIGDPTRGERRVVPQPDGSSRLCLSCHDGTVALGDVAGESILIEMRGEARLTPDRSGFIGTDLSGSHPVSIRYPETDPRGPESDADMGLRNRSVVATDLHVKLDAGSKVQCTSCHDPHADRYYQAGKVPRFWVKPTIEEVCLTCHVLR